jgi:hypothetical protein
MVWTGPIVGGDEGFAGAAHDTDACPERSRKLRAAQGADLHEQAKGVGRVYSQGEGLDEPGFIGNS